MRGGVVGELGVARGWSAVDDAEGGGLAEGVGRLVLQIIVILIGIRTRPCSATRGKHVASVPTPRHGALKLAASSCCLVVR